MTIPGNLLTTAMAVMPHTDVDQALKAALSLDIPFWPQLPNYSYYEDMYVQAAEHFPGILLDMENKTLRFSMDKFIGEFEETMAHFEDPDYFDVSPAYSSVYHKFLDTNLKDRPAIRGQLEGPVSFGFNILDQDDRPILFDDNIRPFMFEIMAKRINVQLRRLKEKNTNAFMFIDEPGMQFIFSAMSGYGEQKAKADLDLFFSTIDSPKGIHLCGNPDWDFLLGLDMDVLSLDVYTNAEIFAACNRSIKSFLDRDGVLVWGIVPTGIEAFEKENLDLLAFKLKTIWKALAEKGHELTCTKLYNGELPEIQDFDWLIVMGGPMGVYDEQIYPWLKFEKAFIKEAILAKKFILLKTFNLFGDYFYFRITGFQRGYRSYLAQEKIVEMCANACPQDAIDIGFDHGEVKFQNNFILTRPRQMLPRVLLIFLKYLNASSTARFFFNTQGT